MITADWVQSFAGEDGRRPGVFKYYSVPGRERAGMVMRCPCGCLSIEALACAPCDLPPVWERSGTWDKPTLAPDVVFPCQSRWALRDGVWIPTGGVTGAAD